MALPIIKRLNIMARSSSKPTPVASITNEPAQVAPMSEEAAGLLGLPSIIDAPQTAEVLGLYSQAIAAQEGGAIKAAELAQQCADKLVQLGHKPELTDTGKPGIPEAIKAAVDAAIYTGLLMAGRWSKEQYTLVTLGAEAAKQANRGKERSTLTTGIPQYRLRLAEKMLKLCPDLTTDANARKESTKTTRAATTAGGTASGVAEEPAQAAPAEQVSGINPNASREEYMAALNLMIVATGNLAVNDALLKKVGPAFCAAFAEMIKTLQA